MLREGIGTSVVCRSPFLGLGLAAVVALFATPAVAQTPVITMREAPSLNRAPREPQPATPMSWEQKRSILLREGIDAATRAPTTFSLTPREPYRLPGGYLTRSGEQAQGGWIHNWDPAYPNPTGNIKILEHSRIRLHFVGLKPGTQYLLDLSLYDGAGGEVSVWASCSNTGLVGTNVGRFPGQNGAYHVFVVMPTDNRGNACWSLLADETMSFHRVDVSELGAP
jgi:hypothetical protein